MQNDKSKLKIIFFGTPEFGAVILEKLAESSFKPSLVITEPDKPKGRKQVLTPPPVKVIAQKYKIPVLQPPKIADIGYRIADIKPDLMVVAAFGQILPKKVLEIPKYGCLNVHPSLLPHYRGPSPIQYVILNGDKETGVTIMLMDGKMDHGPILKQMKIKLNGNENFPELHNRLADLGTVLLLNTIPFWIKGLIQTRAQDEYEATYSKIITREDGRINWQKPAEVIEREIRAFYSWPGTYTFWKKEGKWEKRGKNVRLKIIKAKVIKLTGGGMYPVGKVINTPDNKFYVQCGRILAGQQNFLLIEELQPEGEKPMASEDFLRGHPNFIGVILS